MAAAAIKGVTTPLITTASGAKMGKTAAGAVWLSADRLSPYDYWQFWRNTEDADVGRFLRLFTDLPVAEVARMERLAGAQINEAKRVLATEAAALAHGRDAAVEAGEAARAIFVTPETGSLSITGSAPAVEVSASELSAGIPAFALLVASGLAASNGEARRLIRGGGARLNDGVISDETRLVSNADLREGAIKLSAGRKHHRLIRPSV